MRKLMRLSLALAVTGVVALTKAAAAPSVSSEGFKVASGSLQATVGGETKTYKKGDVIPAQAVVTATSDASVTASNGMKISVKSGTTYQAAYTSGGLVDVKAVSGAPVTVAGYGNTYVLPSGSEADVSGGTVEVVAGNVSYTDPDGNSSTLAAGSHLTQSGVEGSYTYLDRAANGSFSSILVSQTTPSQQVAIVNPVSPSAP